MNANAESTLFSIQLQGEFRVVGPSGEDLTPRGQKACAIIAMLATHPDGARSRPWLRERLWSARGRTEGNSSLRQSLSEIRRTLGEFSFAIQADRRMVKLSKDLVSISRKDGLFLEDIFIHDPEYLSWVSDIRRRGSFAKISKPQPKIREVSVPPTVSEKLTYREFPKVACVEINGDTKTSEAIPALRGKLSEFRWLSVSDSTDNDEQFDYTISIGTTGTPETPATISIRDATGRNLWSVTSSQYERIDPTLPLLDDVAGNLASLILINEEQQAADHPKSGDIRNLLARGRWHLNHMTRQDARIANDIFAEAHSLAPANTEVALHIAYAAVARAWAFRLDPASLDEVISIARSAMVRAPHDARGYYNLGAALCFAGKVEMARVTIDEAIQLCPNMAMAWIQQGCNLLAAGDFEQAVPVYHRCLALGRFERRSYVPRCGLGMAYLFLGENNKAISAAERAIAMRPGYWYAHMVRGVALRRLGEHTDAARSFATMRTIFPRVSRLDVEWLPIGDQKALDRVILDAGISD